MSSSKVIEKSVSDSDGSNTPPARRPAARIRIPGSNALHSSITSIKSEHCRVHNNSIKFRNNDEPAEWYEDSSFSGDSNGCSSREMEVMDLRPSDHHAVHHMDTSSLVSLGSKSSSQSSSRSLSKEFKEASGLSELKFSKLPSSLFHVASAGNIIAGSGGDGLASSGEGSIRLIKPGQNSPPLSPVPGQMRGDMPTHWEEANGSNNDEGDEYHRHDSSGESNHHSSSDSNPHHRRRRPTRQQSSLSLRISNNGRFLLGESEQAYRVLMALMSANGNHNLARGYPSSSESGMGEEEGSSLVSHSDSNSSRASGFWSELGDVARSIAGSHDDSDLTDNSPSSRERRRRRQMRRKLYVKRCVRGMVGVVALSMLSMSAIYFLTEDRQLTLNMNFLGEMSSGEQVNNTEVGEHQRNQWELSELSESESEVDSQLRVRELIKDREGTSTMTEHIGLLVDMAELVADELENSIQEMASSTLGRDNKDYFDKGGPSPQERNLEAQLRQDYHNDYNSYQEYHQEYGEYPIDKDGRINGMH